MLDITRFISIMTSLDLHLATPSEAWPQISCLHPALSYAATSIFFQLYLKPAVHISFFQISFQAFFVTLRYPQ